MKLQLKPASHLQSYILASDLMTGVGLAGSVSVRHFCSVMLTDEDR